MQSRRSLRLAAGALVLALPLLGGCGFDKATDKVYTPAAGTNARDGAVKILSAVVVSAQPDSGTFIATLADDTAEEASFEGLSGAGEWTDLQIPDFEAVEIPARGHVNLADGDGVTVTGDFTPGEFMELTLTFASGQSTTMDVPVVFACEEWSGLDTSVSGGASEEPSASAEPSPGQVPSESASPSDTETSAAPDSGAADTYDCGAVLEEE